MDRAPFANTFGPTTQGQKTMALCKIPVKKKNRHDLRIFPCSAVYFLGTGLGTREARTFSVKIRTMQKPCSPNIKTYIFPLKITSSPSSSSSLSPLKVMASYTPSSSRPHTPLGLSPRGSYTNLASAAYDASSPGGHGAKDEKERLRAEREVQEALLKAQDGVEKAKKEEAGMPASTVGECSILNGCARSLGT